MKMLKKNTKVNLKLTCEGTECNFFKIDINFCLNMKVNIGTTLYSYNM